MTRVAGWLGTLALLSVFAVQANAAEEPPPDGFHFRPSVYWKSGDHKIGIAAQSRWRWENWDARAASHTDILGVQTRISARYSWKDRFALLAEGQHVWITGHDGGSSGVAALYRGRSASGLESATSAFHLKKLFIDVKPTENVLLRLGRQEINVDTMLRYKEPNWNYLKLKRLSQRLVGSLGWTNVTRSYDGGQFTWQNEGYFAHGFAAQPTTGVFENNEGLQFNDDIFLGGLSGTAKRGTLLPNTELTAFFIGYSDARNPADTAGLFGAFEIYTLGANLLGVYPVGPGNVDVLLWAAGQFGNFFTSATNKEDQAAWALIAEAGYQFTGLPWKPWIRTGVNMASGDEGGPGGDTRGSFFNITPTNHLWLGYTDQVAFSNLINWFGQLKLAPHPKLGLELIVHQFWLYSANDFRFFGTGAFDRRLLGYGTAASTGSSDVGTEVDLTATFKLNKHVSFLAGYSYLKGGKAFSAASDRDTQWAVAQILLKY